SRVEAMGAERLQRMFSTNVVGAFLCAREAIRRMSTKHGGKGGAIVNVSSGAARVGSPGECVDYAASKGAIDTMTIGLSKELAEEGIRVNCVRPGFVNTGIQAAAGEPNRIERLRASIPMKRGGEPEEVARAVLWLLSDEASYSTGAILDVTGGREARGFRAPGSDRQRQVAAGDAASVATCHRDRQPGFGPGLPRHGHRHR